MKKILVLGVVLALSACGGGDDPKEAMQHAINEASHFNAVCVPYDLKAEQAQGAVFGAPEVKLLKRDGEGKRVNAEAHKRMEQLVKAGLYRQEKAPKGEKDTPEYALYQLTDEGKEKIHIGHHGAKLCVGTAKAEKINYFTEPTAHRGYTVTQVNYTAKLVPEKWARSLIKEDKILDDMDKKLERNTMLVKTNDGWRDIRELE